MTVLPLPVAIQGLFSDFHNEKENALTIEDFKENKIALIADEAHHINASTKKQTEFRNPLTRLQLFANSFFPSSIKSWNKLSPQLRSICRVQAWGNDNV
jgi:hypothetical protein